MTCDASGTSSLERVAHPRESEAEGERERTLGLFVAIVRK